jgi:phosphate transport system permease protein
MVADAVAVSAAPPRHLTATRRRSGERAIIFILFLCAFLSVVTTIGIVFSLAFETFEFFRDVSIVDFFTGTGWSPLFAQPKFGVLPLLTGTLVTTACALVVCVPFGLGSAIYLSEYASPRARNWLKPIMELLAGIPTVVYGFFALTVVSEFVQRWWPVGDTPPIQNALAAGLVMGVMIIPTVASLSEDAMSAVPSGLRQGGYALGSTRREVATRIVVPAALSGIVAAIVLALSRAIGETTIMLIASGQQPKFTLNPGESMMTLASFIGFAGIGDQPTGSIGYKTIFALGSLLFAITFVMNLVSIRIVRRFRQAYE